MAASPSWLQSQGVRRWSGDRSLPIWLADRLFVHDRLQAGEVPPNVADLVAASDFSHVGEMGMSFGGSTTGAVCMVDKRCAAAVNLDKLGSLVSDAPRDRQSPFALTRGNQFEKQVTDNGMANIVSLARTHLHLEIPEVRQLDLSAAAVREAYPGVTPGKMNELRARLTRQWTEEMLTDPTHAYNLIRHAMTRLDFGGEPVYLEQDVLAFAVNGRLHVVERQFRDRCYTALR